MNTTGAILLLLRPSFFTNSFFFFFRSRHDQQECLQKWLNCDAEDAFVLMSAIVQCWRERERLNLLLLVSGLNSSSLADSFDSMPMSSDLRERD